MSSLEVNAQLTGLNCKGTVLTPCGQRDALSAKRASPSHLAPVLHALLPGVLSEDSPGLAHVPPGHCPRWAEPSWALQRDGSVHEIPWGLPSRDVWGHSNPLACLSSDILLGLSEKPPCPAPSSGSRLRDSAPCSSLAPCTAG